jgi:hypothetical protein
MPGVCQNLVQEIKHERTQTIRPRPEPPKWMDYGKILRAYDFLGKHGQTAIEVMGASSLAATFAAKDIEPVLMQTNRLPSDFDRRMEETGQLLNALFSPPKDRESFMASQYKRAVDLGNLHVGVADMVRKPLGWPESVRVPVNGQAYAFVLYTFAWWPIEAMIATHEVDLLKDREGVDAWFHFWSVIGYGMGVPEELLPRDYDTASKIVVLLRRAQYPAKDDRAMDGIPTLLGGHVRMLSEAMSADTKLPPKDNVPAAAKMLAGLISLAPGLNDALGLGSDPVVRLVSYAALPPAKARP